MRSLGEVQVIHGWRGRDGACVSKVATNVSACLMISHGLRVREAQGLVTDEELDTWMRHYHQLRREALALPAVTDGDRAALAILTITEMRRDVVRRDGDLAGMAMLALAEDLIARIM